MPQDKGTAHQRRQRTTWLDKAIEISQNFEYPQVQLSTWKTTCPIRSASGASYGPSCQNPTKVIPDPPNKDLRDSTKSDFNKDTQRMRMRNAGTVAGNMMNNRLCLIKKCDTCNQLNHFAATYRSILNVNEVSIQPDQGVGVKSDNDFYINSIDTFAHNPCESTDKTFRYLDLGPGRVTI